MNEELTGRCFSIRICPGLSVDLSKSYKLGTTYVPGSACASAGYISDTNGITWTGTITGSTDLTAAFAVMGVWVA
jgi:hypothetical protein